MNDDCVKKYGCRCNCVSCSEDRYEEAHRRAMRMNVWDADVHDFYEGFEED